MPRSTGEDHPTRSDARVRNAAERRAAAAVVELHRPTIDGLRRSLEPGTVSAHLDGILALATTWEPARLVDEVLDLANDSAGSDWAILHGGGPRGSRCRGCRPAAPDPLLTRPWSLDGTPWGLTVRPERFVFVHDAAHLPLGATLTLGSLGVHSALHLPLPVSESTGGGPAAMHLLWRDRRDDWDAALGDLLREVGAMALEVLAVPASGRVRTP